MNNENFSTNKFVTCHFAMLRYIESNFVFRCKLGEPGLEPGLLAGLEPGLDPGLEFRPDLLVGYSPDSKYWVNTFLCEFGELG